MKAKIISTEGYFNTNHNIELEKFGLTIGDIIEVRRLTSNSFIYVVNKDCLILYSHQIEILC